MRRKIPEQTILICDACGKQKGERGQGFAKDARVRFEQHALDFHGCPAASGGWEWDLCDDCASRIGTAMYQQVEAIKATTKN